jgi:DNA (cytosine-5)-methyltransferase 1
MTGRPRLLDLFCGAGGAAMGYHRAGFDVVGVDIDPQPHYPFRFYQADALAIFDVLNVTRLTSGFDVIHASPPCQRFTQISTRWRGQGGLADQRTDLLTPTRERFSSISTPWVIENVPSARRYMRASLILHGGMFGLGVHRPRLFESNVLILAAPERSTINPVGVYGDHPQHHYSVTMRRARTLAEAQEAMGMDWGDWHGVKEAIPPAYTEFIGRQLMEHLRERAA